MTTTVTTPPLIVTSCWRATLPERVCRVGISLGVPRGMAGFRLYKPLYPGPWFRSVTPEDYMKRYFTEILAPLDPARVVAEIHDIARGRVPALVCWELVKV